jgi:hypothetical protein
MGNYPISVPAAAIMFVKQWTTLNIDDPELQRLTFKNRTFRSATDFFYPFGLKREPISDESAKRGRARGAASWPAKGFASKQRTIRGKTITTADGASFGCRPFHAGPLHGRRLRL